MLNSPGAVSAGMSGDEQPLATEAIASTDPDRRPRIVLFKPKSAELAISAHTPYYGSTSILWGLFKRKTGVGGATRSRSPLIPHLGMVYESVLAPGVFVPNDVY
jgi:hypothetical protein